MDKSLKSSIDRCVEKHGAIMTKRVVDNLYETSFFDQKLISIRNVACTAVGISVNHIYLDQNFAGKKSKTLAIICYVAHTQNGYSQKVIAKFLNKHPSLISKYVKQILMLKSHIAQDKELIEKCTLVTKIIEKKYS